jgi:hypothetical protein
MAIAGRKRGGFGATDRALKMLRLFVGNWDKNRANQNDPMAALRL